MSQARTTLRIMALGAMFRSDAVAVLMSVAVFAAAAGACGNGDGTSTDTGDDVADVSDAADVLVDAELDAALDTTSDTTLDTAVDVTDDSGTDAADVTTDAAEDVVDSDASDAGCSWATPERRGPLPDAIDEASGLAVSAADPLVLWVHNDSGDASRVFAVHADDGLLAEITLEGVNAFDWEDMAAGPCGDERCLYVGDIGDNAAIRPDVTIHRFVEPDPYAGDATVAVESMVVSYPDGATDAEALLVGLADRFAIISKSYTGEFTVYAATFEAGGEQELTHRGTVDISSEPGGSSVAVTGGDFDPVSGRAIFRTYQSIFQIQLDEGSIVDDIIDGELSSAVNAVEIQGEAVAWGEGGYWHVSEGNAVPFYFVACEGD